MVDEFLAAFQKLVSYHEQCTQAWEQSAGELSRWAENLLNHREQRQLYTRLPIHHLSITRQCPRIKEKLIEKLNQKILHYDALLRDRATHLAAQQAEILVLSCRVQELAAAVEPPAMLFQADSRPPLSQLLELSYDIVELYTLQHHKMQVFLNQNGQDKTAFLCGEAFATFLKDVGSKWC
jgi:hypothetical protein